MKSYLKIGMSAALGALMFAAPSAMADGSEVLHYMRPAWKGMQRV